MKISQTFRASNRDEWRVWLEANHSSEQEIWLEYYKASSGKTGIDYESSVEEALCFGWVDSLVHKIDEEKYARKFNPRRAGSPWSAANKARVEKLIAEGRMTAAGLAKYDPEARESTNEAVQRIRRGEDPIPAELLGAVEANLKAWETFRRMAPSRQRQSMSWIASASKAETRKKRLEELIQILEQGKELGLK